jgi:hypothetical protein
MDTGLNLYRLAMNCYLRGHLASAQASELREAGELEAAWQYHKRSIRELNSGVFYEEWFKQTCVSKELAV